MYVRDFRKVGMSILPVLLHGGFGFDIVPNIILHYSKAWVVEDLGRSSVWYIAILAYSDRNFSRLLRSCLRSERSAPELSDAGVADHILHSAFVIDALVSQVLDAPLRQRNIFLRTLMKKGTTTMLKPFIDAGLDLDEGDVTQNYLSLTAELSNTDFFNMLIDAGADCERALRQFCNEAYK